MPRTEAELEEKRWQDNEKKIRRRAKKEEAAATAAAQQEHQRKKDSYRQWIKVTNMTPKQKIGHKNSLEMMDWQFKHAQSTAASGQIDKRNAEKAAREKARKVGRADTAQESNHDWNDLPRNDYDFIVEDVQSTQVNADIRNQPPTATMATSAYQSSSGRHRIAGQTAPRHESSKDPPRVTSRAHAPSDPSQTLGQGREDAPTGSLWKAYSSRDKPDSSEESDGSGEDSRVPALTDNGRHSSNVDPSYGRVSRNPRYDVSQSKELSAYKGRHRSAADYASGIAGNRNSSGAGSNTQGLENTGLEAGTTNELYSIRQDELDFARSYQAQQQAQQHAQYATVPSQQQGAYRYEAGTINDSNIIGQPPNEFASSSLGPSYTSYGTAQSQQQQLYHSSQSSDTPSGYIPEQGYQMNEEAHEGRKRQRRT